MEEWKFVFGSLWKEHRRQKGGGFWNHDDPNIAPFLSMFNSSLSTSLYQMASEASGQLAVSKAWVLRTSQQRNWWAG